MPKKKTKRKKAGKFKPKGLSRLSKGMRQKILSSRLSTVHNLNKILSEEHEERIVNNAGTVKKFGDFKYQDGGTVPVDEPYHIHYSRIGKSEIYMTGNKHDETSLVIDRVKGNTNFGQYVKLKKPPKGMTYLNKHIFKVTKKHRKIGHARRYFAQQGNSLTSPVFEISQTDHDKDTPFYKKTKMKWSLDINKDLMVNKNIDEIDRVVNQGFNSLEYALNPSEGHILRDKSSQNEKLNKLLSREKFISPKKKRRKKKKNLMNPDRKTFSTSTPTSTESSPGGGGPPGSPSGGGAY
jgi:hypothetical protein